jgi:hypothetical protein
MAITALFTPPSMNASQYDEILRQLENAGAEAPQGRLYHICFGTGTSLRVMEVWESQDALMAYGQILMPILHQRGVDPGPPEISEAHNTIQG